jgi:hypothetical protein
MKASRPMTFSTRLVATIVLAGSALWAGTAAAQVYQCKLKNGKVEMRDFPCDASTRPTAPISQQSPQPTTRPNPANSPSYGSPQGFANSGQYEAARSICTRLMDQYDFTAPMLRCGLDDSNCFRRANQESSAIFQRLTALPEWKRQQCDLVMQVEGAASAPQGCVSSQIVKPVPFLGTAEEVIVLADGSVWKDLSYKYLYLYAYSPMVQICAAQSKMILEHGGTTHTFSLMRLK